MYRKQRFSIHVACYVYKKTDFLYMLKFLETLLRFFIYTLVYMAGKKSAEAEATNAELEKNNRTVTEREKVRAKNLNLKQRIPNVWE